MYCVKQYSLLYKCIEFRCWIGKRKLDIACEQTKDIYNFKLRWKPFQLSPNTPEKGIPLLEYIRNKYGEQSAKDIMNNVTPVYKAGKSLVRNCLLMSLVFQACLVIVDLKLGEIYFKSINTGAMKITCLEN